MLESERALVIRLCRYVLAEHKRGLQGGRLMERVRDLWRTCSLQPEVTLFPRASFFTTSVEGYDPF